MNTKRKMYQTNSKVRKYLIENGFSDIHFFPHTRFIKDYHFQNQDFDGIASKGTRLVLFQCKTNRRATKQTIIDYAALSEKYSILCLWFNNDTKKKQMEVNNEKQMPVS